MNNSTKKVHYRNRLDHAARIAAEMMPVIENRNTPAGFVAFLNGLLSPNGRGTFRSLAAARRAAVKHIAAGRANVCIVHDQASSMNVECWAVGWVSS